MAVVAAMLVGGVVTAGCTSSRTVAAHATQQGLSAKLLCGHGLQKEIATSLGVRAFTVTVSHAPRGVVSCRYRTADGVIALSATPSRDRAAAVDYVERLGRRDGRRPESPQFGEGLEALMTADGSVVVRKGREVLVVDVGALPPRFGNPGQAPNVVALAVATTVVGHWSPG